MDTGHERQEATMYIDRTLRRTFQILTLPWMELVFFFVISSFLSLGRRFVNNGIVSVCRPFILLTLISRSLYLDRFSDIFTDVLHSAETATPMSMELFFSHISYYCIWLVGFYLPVGMDWHVPENSDIILFSDCYGLMFVPSVTGFHIIALINLPV